MFDELVKKFTANKKKHHAWRDGQCWFNSLYELNDFWANEVRGKDNLDPFYNDENIPAFLLWVAEEDKEK